MINAFKFLGLFLIACACSAVFIVSSLAPLVDWNITDYGYCAPIALASISAAYFCILRMQS